MLFKLHKILRDYSMQIVSVQFSVPVARTLGVSQYSLKLAAKRRQTHTHIQRSTVNHLVTRALAFSMQSNNQTH